MHVCICICKGKEIRLTVRCFFPFSLDVFIVVATESFQKTHHHVKRFTARSFRRLRRLIVFSQKYVDLHPCMPIYMPFSVFKREKFILKNAVSLFLSIMSEYNISVRHNLQNLPSILSFTPLYLFLENYSYTYSNLDPLNRNII